MAPPTSFTASPTKRIAAFSFDFFAIFLFFLTVVTVAEVMGVDLGSGLVFVGTAAGYHLAFLQFRQGRTFGKQAQDICVVTDDGRPPAFWQNSVRVAVRYIALASLSINLQDSVVTEALASLGLKAVASLLWLGELHFLQKSSTRQTLADRLAKTIVVNMPPAQAHMAPAIPMFSRNDAEFGVPPRVKKPPRPRE